MNKDENVSPVAGCSRLKTSASDRSIPSLGPCASGFRDTDIVSAAAIRRFATRFRRSYRAE